jgi:hypothetical protein
MGKSKFEPLNYKGCTVLIWFPCSSRIADRIQHVICLRSPFYHENDVLIMQISFSDVIKWGRLCSISKCIDKTDYTFLIAGNIFLKYSVLLL